jgi:methylmalonyl-CoA/ethylmalonyl-CoA epimerase
MKLHHIGIVVNNIETSLGELGKYLEFEETTIPMKVESQKVNVCFLKSSSIYLELIEPIGKDSPVKKISELGGGFHHLCFEVDDIFEETKKMEKNGARVIVEPTEGFEGRLISFILLDMKNTNCNLIEFAEKKK